MSVDKTGFSKSDRIEALIGLAVGDAEPAGVRPEVEEIWAWHRGQLSEPRASEVKAHVAKDAECFEIWCELLEAAEQAEAHPIVQAETRERGVDWTQVKARLLGIGNAIFSPRPLAAIAVAALVGAVALSPLLQPSLEAQLTEDYERWGGELSPESVDWPWTQGFPVARSPAVSRRMLHGRAFRHGVRAGLSALVRADPDWRLFIEDIPIVTDECGPAETRCQEQLDSLVELGRWTLLMHFACNAESFGPGSGFWQGQRDRVEALDERLARLPREGPYSSALSGLVIEKMPLCGRAERLMKLGLDDSPTQPPG